MVEALFTGAAATLGSASSEAVSRAFTTLIDAYRGRAYHNFRHIERVLETYLAIKEPMAPEAEAEVVMALCYHDAVYDPQAKDNEIRSAEMAEDELAALGVAPANCAEIARLILLTQDHRVAYEDVAGSLVVDADLAILQASEEEYDRYAWTIRQEYAWVPTDEYRLGRTRVLKGLLARRLFASSLLNEEAAHANLRREIESLSRE